MTTKPDYAELVERLRGLCIDWSGEPIVDGSTPRIETDCGTLRQAADAIASLQAERDEALRRLDPSNGHYEAWLDQIAELVGMEASSVPLPALVEQKIAALTSQLTEAREALRPFAKHADQYDPPESDDAEAAFASAFFIGQLRRARAALSNLQPAGKDTPDA
jgi:hypothetical protein